MLQVSVPRLYKMVFFMSIICHASCISFCDLFNSSSCIIIHHHSPSLIIMHHDLSSFIIIRHHYHVFIMMMFFHHNVVMYTSHNFTIITTHQPHGHLDHRTSQQDAELERQRQVGEKDGSINLDRGNTFPPNVSP